MTLTLAPAHPFTEAQVEALYRLCYDLNRMTYNGVTSYTRKQIEEKYPDVVVFLSAKTERGFTKGILYARRYQAGIGPVVWRTKRTHPNWWQGFRKTFPVELDRIWRKDKYRDLLSELGFYNVAGAIFDWSDPAKLMITVEHLSQEKPFILSIGMNFVETYNQLMMAVVFTEMLEKLNAEK